MSQAQKIADQLWEDFRNLFRNMDSNEYRNYVLGFLFYRYLSEHQEEHLVSNEIVSLKPGQSINEAYIDAVSQEDDLDDYLDVIADSLGYAIEPKYTWASIVKKVYEGAIIASDYQDMLESFNRNLDRNKFSKGNFAGILDDMDLENPRLGATTASKATRLTKIIELINRYDFFDDKGKYLLGDIYVYLIAKFVRDAGKKAGEFLTPAQVSDLLSQLVTEDIPQNTNQPTIYDYVCGSGSLLLAVADKLPEKTVHYYGQELNTSTYNMARMNLMIHNVRYQNMNLKNSNALHSDWPDGPDANGIDHPRRFDMIVADPPFSIPWDNNNEKIKDPRFKQYGVLAPKSRADYAFLLHGLYHLKANGTMAIVMPHGVLFRGGAEGKIRQALIDKNEIDAIIGLPPNLFYSTSISTVVLVLKKNKVNMDVLFIDGSMHFKKNKSQNVLRKSDIEKIISAYRVCRDINKYSHVANINEIKENEYNLNISRYIDTFEPDTPIDLGELTKELRETQNQINKVEKKMLSMVKQLSSDDRKTRKDLNRFIKMLSDDVKRNG